MQRILELKESEICEMLGKQNFVDVLFEGGDEITFALMGGQIEVMSEQGAFNTLLFDYVEDAIEFVNDYGQVERVEFEEISMYI